MTYQGWLRFGGSEIINASRTLAYAAALVPKLHLDGCDDCPDLRYVVNQKRTLPDNRDSVKSGAQYERETQYTTPKQDRAEWYDANDPDSADFVGFYPLEIIGLDGDTREATVVEGTLDGGQVLLPRRATREVRVSGLLIGKTEAGMEVGQRWLRNALDNTPCDGDCEGDPLCFFSSCPSVRLDGYDYDAEPLRFLNLGAYGWRNVGGIMVPNTDNDTLLFTSEDAPNDRIEFTPFGAVEDKMTFTVSFNESVEETRPVLRSNVIPNPSFGLSQGETVVRKNLVHNPAMRSSVYGWGPRYGVGGLTRIIRKGDDPSDTNRPDIASTSPVQNYLQVIADNAATPIEGAGAASWVFDATPGPYVAGMWLQAPVATTATVRIEWLNSLNVVIASESTDIDQSAHTWFPVITTREAPIGTTGGRVYVGTTGAGTFTSGQVVLNATGFRVERGIAASGVYQNYFDGTYAPPSFQGGLVSRWSGTPDLSASEAVGAGLYHSLMVSAGQEMRGYHHSAGRARFIAYNSGSAQSDLYDSNGEADWNAAAEVTLTDSNLSPVNAVLRVVAMNDVGVSEVEIAASPATPLVTGQPITLVATGVPGATTTRTKVALRIDFFGDVGMTHVIDVDKILLGQNASGTTETDFFDGNSATADGFDYAWTGTPNDSPSNAYDVDVPEAVLVRLEAYGDGEYISSIEGSTSASDLALTVDGRGYGKIQWVLRPLEEGTVIVRQTNGLWRIPWGYDDVFFGAYTRYPDGFYGPEGPGIGGGYPDPISSMIEHQARRYRRFLSNVKAVRGPTVTEVFPSRSACMVKVEFYLVAGSPFIYGDESEPEEYTLALEVADEPDRNGSQIMTKAIPRCTPVPDPGPVENPGCEGSIPRPPKAPVISQMCSLPPGPIVRRYALPIPSTLVPKFSEVLPIIGLYPQGEETMPQRVNIIFYPSPVPNADPTTLSPCSACYGFTVTNIGSDGIVIDGSIPSVYSRWSETVSDGDGGYTYSGRTVDRPAQHMLLGLDGGPFEFPVLSCGVSYYMVVEAYSEDTLNVVLTTVPRR